MTVSAPVTLRGETNVTAMQADVLFNPALASSGDATPGAALRDSVLASSQPSSGVRRILIYSLSNTPLVDGVIANLPFSISLEAGGVVPLRLTKVILVKADAMTVVSTNINGLIGISPVFLHTDGHAEGFLTVVSNAVEQCYVVQATTDFVTWVNLATNSVAGTLLEFADPDAAGYPFRFYRAIVCDALTGAQRATIQWMEDGRMQFDFTGATGRSYVIQASTDLLHWASIATNVVTGSAIQVTDAEASRYPQRFYRLRSE